MRRATPALIVLKGDRGLAGMAASLAAPPGCERTRFKLLGDGRRPCALSFAGRQHGPWMRQAVPSRTRATRSILQPSSQIAARDVFSARGIDLALGWHSGTPDPRKRSSESDFDSDAQFDDRADPPPPESPPPSLLREALNLLAPVVSYFRHSSWTLAAHEPH